MKRALAVALLLMSFTSVALADGSGPPPSSTANKPPKPFVQLVDGSGPPPVSTQKPPKPVAA